MLSMRKKLKSSLGASLGISLLLFLVCSVLGSLILTAGTTTLGRVFSMSDMDQRYYSVTSAAELMSKELTDKTVTIVRKSVRSGSQPETYQTGIQLTVPKDKNAVDGDKEYINVIPSQQPSDEDDIEPIDAKTAMEAMDASGLSFIVARAVDLMYGTDIIPENPGDYFDNSFADSEYDPKNADAINFKVEHKDDIDERLLVNGTCEMKKDGTLTIGLANTDNSYTLVLTLTPTFHEETSERTETKYDTGRAVNVKTVVKTSSVSWEVASVKKDFTPGT